MSSASPFSKSGVPGVQHSFDGDVKILNSTFDRRMEMRKALAGLQRDLQRIEGRPTQIKAEIKLCIGGPQAKEHNYTVTATSSDFDVEDFLRQIPESSAQAHVTAFTAGKELSCSPAPTAAGEQQATTAQSTPRPESRKADGDDDDVVEIRPFKRPKPDGEITRSQSSRDGRKDSASKAPEDAGEVFDFLKQWHGEWVRQGGFLYDQLSAYQPFMQGTVGKLEKKMDGVQDVLGQSINSATANTMAELNSISKLIPWLEHCRKTSADKVQAREEKWRTSSATFHDQSRREREAAEKRIEKQLEEQRELMMKVARASGIGIEDWEGLSGGGRDRSTEESLGAQLTAELNMEAEEGHGYRSDPEHETINIDDD